MSFCFLIFFSGCWSNQSQFCVPFHLEPPDFSRAMHTRILKVQCNILEWVKHATSPTDVWTGSSTATRAAVPHGNSHKFEPPSKEKRYGTVIIVHSIIENHADRENFRSD